MSESRDQTHLNIQDTCKDHNKLAKSMMVFLEFENMDKEYAYSVKRLQKRER